MTAKRRLVRLWKQITASSRSLVAVYLVGLTVVFAVVLVLS